MFKSAQQAAIDQACLLASYLAETPPSSLDLAFIQCHLDALSDFAQVARREATDRLSTQPGVILAPSTGSATRN